jgi:hypothetical protein
MKAIVAMMLGLSTSVAQAQGSSPLAQHFTEYVVPFGANSLAPITAGPDGALW